MGWRQGKQRRRPAGSEHSTSGEALQSSFTPGRSYPGALINRNREASLGFAVSGGHTDRVPRLAIDHKLDLAGRYCSGGNFPFRIECATAGGKPDTTPHPLPTNQRSLESTAPRPGSYSTARSMKMTSAGSPSIKVTSMVLGPSLSELAGTVHARSSPGCPSMGV